MKLLKKRLRMGKAVSLENNSGKGVFESVEVYLLHKEVHRGEQNWRSSDGS